MLLVKDGNLIVLGDGKLTQYRLVCELGFDASIDVEKRLVEEGYREADVNNLTVDRKPFNSHVFSTVIGSK